MEFVRIQFKDQTTHTKPIDFALLFFTSTATLCLPLFLPNRDCRPAIVPSLSISLERRRRVLFKWILCFFFFRNRFAEKVQTPLELCAKLAPHSANPNHITR